MLFKVERLGGHGKLEEYMTKNIWGPLGITTATFRLKQRDDIRSHLLEMLTRDEEGRLKVSVESEALYTFSYDAGGAGMFIKPTDYAKLLEALLRNDGTILKPETVDLMFTPQLQDSKYLVEYIKANPFRYTMLAALPVDIEYNWGLGGILAMEDVPGKRRKDSLSWSGLPNLQVINLPLNFMTLMLCMCLLFGILGTG